MQSSRQLRMHIASAFFFKSWRRSFQSFSYGGFPYWGKAKQWQSVRYGRAAWKRFGVRVCIWTVYLLTARTANWLTTFLHMIFPGSAAIYHGLFWVRFTQGHSYAPWKATFAGEKNRGSLFIQTIITDSLLQSTCYPQIPSYMLLSLFFILLGRRSSVFCSNSGCCPIHYSISIRIVFLPTKLNPRKGHSSGS